MVLVGRLSCLKLVIYIVSLSKYLFIYFYPLHYIPVGHIGDQLNGTFEGRLPGCLYRLQLGAYVILNMLDMFIRAYQLFSMPFALCQKICIDHTQL